MESELNTLIEQTNFNDKNFIQEEQDDDTQSSITPSHPIFQKVFT